MADVKKLVNYTGKERGLDLKSSNLRRAPQFATEANNCDYDSEEDLTRRPGYMPSYESTSSDLGGFGAVFHGLDDSGDPQEITQIIANKNDGTVLQMNHGSLELEYTGVSADIQLTAKKYHDGTSYVFKILNGASELFSQNLGDGETLTVAMSALVSAINAAAIDVTASLLPSAALLNPKNAAHMENLSIDFGVDTNSGNKTALFRVQYEFGIISETTLPASRKYSSTIVNDVLYIASSEGGSIKKYDGNRFYVAGLPKYPYSSSLISLIFGTPDMPNGYYRYAFEFEYTDNAGNVVKGGVSDSGIDAFITGAGQQIQFLSPTVPSGYVNKYEAKDTGQPDVTYSAGDVVNFPLTAALPDFKEGDTVYWYSPVNTLNDPYEVAGAETTQTLQKGRVLSVSGFNVEVKVQFDGSFTDEFPDISTMAINVYRTLGEGLASHDDVVDNYYLVGTFPTTIPGNQIMVDTLSDADLQTRAQLGFLDTDAWPELPYGKYIARYRNHLLITGVDNEADIVHFSEAGFPENFPKATNSFSVGGGQIADSVTGIGTSEDYFLVFKDRSVYRVTGDLGSAFALDLMRVGVGCVSHYSIREIQQGRIAFLTHKGPFQCFRGQDVVPLGAASAEPDESRLAPVFYGMNQSQAYDNGVETSYRLDRATSCVAPGLNKYYIHVPAFTESDYDSGEPRTFVYDFEHDTWSEWTGIRITDEIFSLNSPTIEQAGLNGSGFVDVVFWIGKKDQSATKNFLIEQYKGTYDTDFNDWGSVIPWKYATHWENFDSPSQQKKFLHVNIFSIGNVGFDLRFRQQINWDDSTDSTDVTFPFTANDTNLIVNFGEQRARANRIIFENTEINQRIKISGYELEINTPYLPSSKE